VASSHNMMVFVDGENLVMRFQDMVNKGSSIKPDVVHVQDAFVWCPRVIKEPLHNIVRATYYTYAIGDDVSLSDLSDKIKQNSFTYREENLVEAVSYFQRFIRSTRKQSNVKV
jgi:hypothetical protein